MKPAFAGPEPPTAVPARLSFFGFPATNATARVRENDPQNRLRRALMAFAAGLGLAVLGVFIPIAHFFLVPGFLLGGLFLGLRRLRERRTLIEVRGTCPRCGVEQTFEAGGQWRGSARVTCSNCHNTLDLEGIA
jgi:hypothetical protein